MLARSALTLVLSLGAPVALAAQSFEYAPGTGQYRVASKASGAQEAMGQKQDFTTSNDQLVTITLARATKDTLAMTVVIDSIAVVGPMGMTPPGLDKLVGLKLMAKLSPFGAFYSAEVPKDTALPGATQIVEGLKTFLPRIRGKLATGTTWTDTVSGKMNQNGFDVDRRVISKFTVVGDTTVGGEKSWNIARETTTTLSGSGAPQGQPATMEGTSTAKGTVLISQKGVFVGSRSEDQSNIKILLAANGLEIGVTSTVNTTVDKVK